MSKLLTVFGATGIQGGSVVRAILAHPVLSKEFRVRAITRDPSKPSGQALAAQGVEVVKADLSDKDSLTAALVGSHSVFAVTNYWDSLSKEAEIAQGRNIADVAAAVGVSHLIWSTLTDVSGVSNGALPNVTYFDGKAEIDRYMRSLNLPITSFYAGFYMSNLKASLRRDDAGVYSLSWPVPATTPLPFFESAQDTGKFAAAILLNREKLLGATVYGASGWWSGADVIAIFERATGRKGEFRELDADAYKRYIPQPEPIKTAILENFHLIRDYKYFGPDRAEEQLEASIALLEQPPVSLEEFVKGHDWDERIEGGFF